MQNDDTFFGFYLCSYEFNATNSSSDKTIINPLADFGSNLSTLIALIQNLLFFALLYLDLCLK